MKNKVTELMVEGMTCVNCAKSVSKFLEKKGLSEVNVNFATKEVSYAGDFDLDKITQGIEKLGFHVIDTHSPKQGVSLLQKLIFCGIFTIPLFLHMFIPWHVLHNPYVQLVLTIPVFLVGISHFGRSAWGSIRNGFPNMDVLIFIGSSAAFIYSLSGTLLQLGPDYLFYETAAMIITLVLLGNYLEERAVAKTTSAIGELNNLQVEKAIKVVEKNGQKLYKEVQLKDIEIGDFLQVNQGDQIPMDGIIIDGSGSINEAMITGESLPVEKIIGQQIVGATVLVKGNILMQVTAKAKDSMLAKIISLVKNAQSDKPEIQRLADKISAIFVPAVLFISLLTFLVAYFGFAIPFQKALMNAIAVLVVSCPCAMGLATPTAIMVGVGRAAKNGILIRGGQTLERFGNVSHIVFDKTGTLTTGNFGIKEISNFSDYPLETIKGIIYDLEQHSSHPIAQSLVQQLTNNHYADHPIQLLDIKEREGYGVEGFDQEKNHYQLGSFDLVSDICTDNSHLVYLRKNDELLAWIDLEDELKNQATETIAYLNKEKINTIILSGDRNTKTQSLAQKIGIQSAFGEQKPDQKLEKIAAYNKEGLTAMVGDGINDAPALTKADIGISMGNASKVAIQSADVILLNKHLPTLQDAHKISKATLTTIKQNLFWAFAYNVVAIPVAALGFLNPMWGAIFMAFSDVIVIGNSIRLRSKKL